MVNPATQVTGWERRGQEPFPKNLEKILRPGLPTNLPNCKGGLREYQAIFTESYSPVRLYYNPCRNLCRAFASLAPSSPTWTELHPLIGIHGQTVHSSLSPLAGFPHRGRDARRPRRRTSASWSSPAGCRARWTPYPGCANRRGG